MYGDGCISLVMPVRWLLLWEWIQRGGWRRELVLLAEDRWALLLLIVVVLVLLVVLGGGS